MNPFNKPEFIIESVDGQIELIIRRISFLPPIFEVISTTGTVGRVCVSSMLRNQYTIEINEGDSDSWVFRMPLFNGRFRADSINATDVWVAMGPTEMEWNILVRPGVQDRRLVPVLAFIHNERWHYL